MIAEATKIEQFRENGFLAPVDVLDTTAADRVRDTFDELERRIGRESAEIGILNRHFEERFIWELAIHPTILNWIESILGPNVLLLATHFFCKYGRSESKFVAWHQDVTYWGLEPPIALTAWLAVDDADTENGCMRVIPGSHKGGIREHGKSDAKGNLLSTNQEITVSPEEEGHAVDLCLRAGQMSLHDGSLIHGSLPNRSSRRRCGLTLRYVPTDCRQIQANSQGENWRTVLVRGENREHYFKDLPPPF